MKRIALVLAALSLPGCVTVDGHRKFDAVKACNIAVRSATTVQQLTSIAIQFGVKEDKAADIARAAIVGHIAIDAVCSVILEP